MSKTILILGATGHVGNYAVSHALDAQDEVYVFVRNPAKLPVSVKDRLRVIEGDLTKTAAVASAVEAICPDAIIICSGHPPTDPIAPLNEIVIQAIVKALTANRRLNDCFVIYLSGLFSDPEYDPLPWFAKVVRTILVPLSGFQASLADNLAVTRYLTSGDGAKSGLNFTIVRMGYPVEAARRGKCPLEGTPRRS